MSSAAQANNPVGNPEPGSDANRDLLSALAGHQAGHESFVAQRTRRVVSTSLGVMQEQSAGRKRIRAIALASSLLAVLALGPFLWRLTDDLIAGESICGTPAQLSLLICVLCSTLVAAVIVAGWARRR